MLRNNRINLENIKRLQEIEQSLKDRISDLKFNKITLEKQLEAKEKEINYLNHEVGNYKTEIDKYKTEFNNQRKKLDSLAKNYNEMKMERAKLQSKINRTKRNVNYEIESQS